MYVAIKQKTQFELEHICNIIYKISKCIIGLQTPKV